MSLQKVRALSSKVDATLSKCFESLGTAISKRPLLTILTTSLLAFALFPGMLIGGQRIMARSFGHRKTPSLSDRGLG